MLFLLIVSATAAETVASGNCYNSSTQSWTLDSEGTLTISGAGVLKGAAFPEDFPWYDYTDSITKIVVSPGITEIGQYGLRYLSSVTEVVLPDTVTALGSSAFNECGSLESIDLPDSITSIGGAAFWGCKKLVTIDLPANLTQLGLAVFEYCTSLETITIPDGVTAIGDRAFDGCSALTSIELPAGLKSIGVSAFANCSSLSEIDLPAGLTAIGMYAFNGCTSLQTVTIPDGVAEIASKTFYGCSSLTQVHLPEQMTALGEQAFYGCDALKSVVIPEGITDIPKKAFYGCESLRFVTLPESLLTLGTDAFNGCDSLISLILPAGLESVGSNAFYHCDCLDMLVVNGEATEFSSTAFRMCSTDLIFWGVTGSPAETYAQNSGYTFYSLGTDSSRFSNTEANGLTWTLSDSFTVLTISGSAAIPDYSNASEAPWVPYADMVTTIIIEDGVSSVGACSFTDFYQLTALTLGDSVTSIGDFAFSGCTSLTQIIPGDGLVSIGEQAFSNCTSLTQGVPGENLVSVGARAFYGCTSLQSISLAQSLTTLGSEAFRGCTALSTVSMGSGLQVIGTHTFADCPVLSTLSLMEPNPYFNLINNVLYSNDGTTLVWYPAGSTETDYTIRSGTTAIADDAFYQCIHLQNVVIPDSVVAIGARAFYDCRSIVALFVPDSVISIGVDAFYNCSLQMKPVPQTGPVASTNRDTNNYAYTFCDVISSNLVAMDDGSFLRVESLHGSYYGSEKGLILVERYVLRNGVLQWESGFIMEQELQYFGGYYFNGDYHFLIFGQSNPEMSDEKEVIRVVKYSKDWSKRLDCAQLYGAQTIAPFAWGTARCSDYNGYLYIRTCHGMYNGHQGNQTINIDIDTMEIASHYSIVMNPVHGFAAHSFNQFISTEDGVLVGVDHADGNPRAIVICRYYEPAGQAAFVTSGNRSCDFANVFTFEGERGDNFTGATMGGFQISDSSYLTAGSSIVQDADHKLRSTRNIFVTATPKDDLTAEATQVHWYTNYTVEGGPNASNPHLVEINQNKYLLIWSERTVTHEPYYDSDGDWYRPIYAGTDKVFYLYIDGEGNPLSEVQTFTGGLSDCAPIVVEETAYWYTTENGLPVFYALSGDILLRTDSATQTRTVKVFSDATLILAEYQDDGRFCSARLIEMTAGQSAALPESAANKYKLFLADPDTMAPISTPVS